MGKNEEFEQPVVDGREIRQLSNLCHEHMDKWAKRFKNVPGTLQKATLDCDTFHPYYEGDEFEYRSYQTFHFQDPLAAKYFTDNVTKRGLLVYRHGKDFKEYNGKGLPLVVLESESDPIDEHPFAVKSMMEDEKNSDLKNPWVSTVVRKADNENMAWVDMSFFERNQSYSPQLELVAVFQTPVAQNTQEFYTQLDADLEDAFERTQGARRHHINLHEKEVEAKYLSELVDFNLDKRLREYLYERQRSITRELAEKMEKLYPFADRPYGKIFVQESKNYKERMGEALRDYTSSEFQIINMLMRNPSLIDEKRFFLRTLKGFYSARIISFLTRYGGPQAPIDMTIFRGMGIEKDAVPEFLETMQPGRDIVVKEFMSTTPSVRVAKNFYFAYKGSVDLKIMYVMSVPKGTPMRVVSLELDAKESEIILPNCTKWKIDEVVAEDRSTVRIYMHLTGIGKINYGYTKEKAPQTVQEVLSSPTSGGLVKSIFGNMFKSKKVVDEKGKAEVVENNQIEELFKYVDEYTTHSYATMLTDWAGEDAITKKTAAQYENYKENGGCAKIEAIEAVGAPTALLQLIEVENAAVLAIKQMGKQLPELPAVALVSIETGQIDNIEEVLAAPSPSDMPETKANSLPEVPPTLVEKEVAAEEIVKTNKQDVKNVVADFAPEVQKQVLIITQSVEKVNAVLHSSPTSPEEAQVKHAIENVLLVSPAVTINSAPVVVSDGTEHPPATPPVAEISTSVNAPPGVAVVRKLPPSPKRNGRPPAPPRGGQIAQPPTLEQVQVIMEKIEGQTGSVSLEVVKEIIETVPVEIPQKAPEVSQIAQPSPVAALAAAPAAGVKRVKGRPPPPPPKRGGQAVPRNPLA